MGISQTTSMSTSMKSSSQSSSTMTSKKSTASRNVQINVGSKKKSVVAVSANSMAEERKLRNPRGRKVTRQGDWLVFTEKVGILTSQNGVQQVREERVKINSEDLDRLVGLGF